MKKGQTHVVLIVTIIYTYAMYGQGRVLVLIKGYPIGQILIPGRDEGHMLRSTHPQFIPGTNQLIICSNDIEMGGGSMLYG